MEGEFLTRITILNNEDFMITLINDEDERLCLFQDMIIMFVPADVIMTTPTLFRLTKNYLRYTDSRS